MSELCLRVEFLFLSELEYLPYLCSHKIHSQDLSIFTITVGGLEHLAERLY